MAAYAGGDENAFRELFQRYAPRLFGYLNGMCRDRESARDMVQETFLRVHRSRDRYDPERPFRPWLFRIATNVHNDRHKSWIEVLARRTRSLFDPDLKEGNEPAAPERARPDRRAERTVMTERLTRELAALPRAYRQVLLLRDGQELTCRETAEALGRPVGTVLSLVWRGRRLLRESLERKGGRDSWV